MDSVGNKLKNGKLSTCITEQSKNKDTMKIRKLKNGDGQNMWLAKQITDESKRLTDWTSRQLAKSES